MTRPPPRSPLFPYTTLFRSHTSELQSHSHLVCRLLEFRRVRSEEHTSELQSHSHLVCRLLLEKKRHAIFAAKSGDGITRDLNRRSVVDSAVPRVRYFF